MNPFGLAYSEITASSLVKVDMQVHTWKFVGNFTKIDMFVWQGNMMDRGTTNFGMNLAGFVLHSAIHKARPDIRCIVHIHTPSVVAVSSLKCGLLSVSQEACLLGEVSYHDYGGIVLDEEEKHSLAKDFGYSGKVMLLRNHGAVCGGATIEEAFYLTYHLVLACEAQVKLLPVGVDNLVTIPEETRQKAFDQSRQSGGGGVDSKEAEGARGERKKFKLGEMEFEAFMRMLDNSVSWGDCIARNF